MQIIMNTETVHILLFCLVAYLFGSCSISVFICKIMKLPDPRFHGSQNPGTTNVLRIGGKKAALFTLLGDILKGVLPVLLAKWAHLSPVGLAMTAFAAFLGHLYPLFFHFKGGKGVATALGCLFALAWPVGLALIVTWLLVAIITRYSSLAALIAALCAPFYAWIFTNTVYTIMIVLMSLLLIYRHKKNIQGLLIGTESKIKL